MLVTKLFRSIVAAAALAVAVPAAAQDRTASTAIKDAWITTQIQAKYFGDSVVKGRNIDVDTRSGAVTLTGEVSSAAERTRAVEKAREVDGVTTVHDKLTIVSGKADHAVNRTKVKNKADKAAPDRIDNQITDVWITTKVQSKYFLDADVKGSAIDVTTNGGVVTLTGKVGTAGERQKALALAKSTDGVKQVIDKLTLGK